MTRDLIAMVRTIKEPTRFSERATRQRRAERASDQPLQEVPSARTVARMMTSVRNHLSKTDTITIAAIEAGVPVLVEARS